jgi:hypothetical protein
MQQPVQSSLRVITNKATIMILPHKDKATMGAKQDMYPQIGHASAAQSSKEKMPQQHGAFCAIYLKHGGPFMTFKAITSQFNLQGISLKQG